MEARWELNELLNGKSFDDNAKDFLKRLAKYDSFKLNPEMSASEFKKLLDFDEEISITMNKLAYYGHLMNSTDVSSEEAKFFKAKGEELEVKFDDKTRRISHWLKGMSVEGLKKLDDKNAKRLFSSVPDEYVLNHMRKAAKHTLSQPEERIMTRKSITGSSALLDLYRLIAADFEFEWKPGKIIKTQAELTTKFRSHKAEDRKASYQALFKKYKQHLSKFFVIYKSLVKDWGDDVELRKYSSPIGMRNFANDVPDKAIEMLLEVCRENRKIYQEYFKLKAKMLGMKKLQRYDVYAPLQEPRTDIKYEEAKKIVLENFKKFNPKFAEFADKIIKAKHIDSHPRENKEPGAFCATVTPKLVPYVMLNFAGTHNDVETLAHELGHGIHCFYARDHSIRSYHAALPLCETASTFGEMIVFEDMLSKASDKEKKALLADKLGHSYASIIRQAYFVLFEVEAHKKIKEGVMATELCDLYFKFLKEQFGESLKLNEEFKYEWSYIPHIYQSPFYCYAYNFGELLSMALYSRYKKEGVSFIPKIESILTAGGSKEPVKVLKEIGIDMTSKEFWEGSFELIKKWMEELKKLV